MSKVFAGIIYFFMFKKNGCRSDHLKAGRPDSQKTGANEGFLK